MKPSQIAEGGLPGEMTPGGPVPAARLAAWQALRPEGQSARPPGPKGGSVRGGAFPFVQGLVVALGLGIAAQGAAWGRPAGATTASLTHGVVQDDRGLPTSWPADFAQQPAEQRRALALQATQGAWDPAGQAIARVLQQDQDPQVRLTWVRWTERVERESGPQAEPLEGIVAAWIEALEGEWHPEVRSALVERLAQSAHPGAQVWVAGQWLRGEPALARALAKEVRPGPTHQGLIRTTVRTWVEQGEPLAAEVLAELLPHYGSVLADGAGSQVLAREAWPIVVGLHHADERLRKAAAQGLQNWLDRLVEREDPVRFDRHLAALERSGVDARILRFEEARVAFTPLADGERALAAAQALTRIEMGQGTDPEQRAEQTRRWRFRGQYLEGLAHLALRSPGEARRAFQMGLASNSAARKALAHVDGGSGEDAAPREERAELSEVLQERILLLMGWNLSVALEGHLDPVADRGTQAGLRVSQGLATTSMEHFVEAHRLHLQVQVLHAGLTGQTLGGWDGLFDHAISPYRLVLHGRGFEQGLDVTEQLAMELWLGRGLATVSPEEIPGLIPWPSEPQGRYGPEADPIRRARLLEIHWARVDHLTERLDRLQERIAARQRSPLGQVPEEDLEAYSQQSLQHRLALRALEQLDGRSGREGWVEVRVAGGHALRYARGLRSAGRLSEARTLIQRYLQDLESGGIGSTWFYLGQEQLARADIELGANYSDDEQPEEAERALLRGVGRLQGIVDRLQEVGASAESLRPYQDQLAGAYVSLAVNANVRLGEPERALEFYEQAYALKQDDFMRVLLACYRARSGHGVEARSLLASVTPAPPLYYNLACTHALLGDHEEALRWLRLELAPERREPAALERQKQWAQGDPDLVSLRGLPEFEALVAPAPEPKRGERR